MRFARVKLADGSSRSGIVEGDAVIEVEGDIFSGYGATDRIVPIEEVRFLPPTCPSKIIAIGTNFRDHAAEMGKGVPTEPKIFLKPPSALIGHRAPIRLPEVPGNVDYEAEAALVIGRTARHVSEEDALKVVFGYTCLNDVTARELQRKDGVYARAKGFDTFAPTGPWIETDLLWDELVVEGWVNGVRRQQGALCDLVFSVPQVIAFVSSIMTLLPGDIISLGTPVGVGPLAVGDRVEVRLNLVGTLENPVERDPLSRPPIERTTP